MDSNQMPYYSVAVVRGGVHFSTNNLNCSVFSGGLYKRIGLVFTGYANPNNASADYTGGISGTPGL
jgi:hypothetical protein